MNGIQPTCPSERAILMSGWRASTPEQSQSTSACTEFSAVRAIPASKGASGAVIAIWDDDPMCMLMTVPVSLHASKNGVQWLP